MFDTLMYAKRLEAAGMSREQAEAEVQIIAEMVVDGVATKNDIVILQGDMAFFRTELASLRAEFKADLNSDISSVRMDMIAMEHRLTIRMGLMMMASTTLTVTILSLLK